LTHSVAGSSLATPVRVASVALAVAVTAAAAQFTMPLPGTDVPFVLTPMAVMLTGAALGSRLGALSQMIYLTLGAIGLAVFSPDPRLPHGVLRLVGPTGGYLMAYPFAAFLSGWLAERGWDRRYLLSLAAMLAGLAVIYAGGVMWRLGMLRSLDLTVATSIVPFLVPDVIKAAIAAAMLPAAWRTLGKLEVKS
jgi:biotin transport system substrate-specific component